MTFKNILLILTTLIGLSFNVPAQQHSTQEPPSLDHAGKDTIPYDTSQLKTFAKLLKKLKPIQEEQQKKMEKKIRKTGLSLKKYREVHMAQMSKGREDLSKRSIRKYKEATRKIQEVRTATKKKMDSLIRKEGMEPELYNEMATAYQKNSRMRKAVRKLLK